MQFPNSEMATMKYAMAIKIVKLYSVSPSEGAAPLQSLPLLYFDLMWLRSPHTQTLHFYPLKCSQSSFLDTVAMKLKHSLSITLNHFLPLASKIIFPLTSATVPVSRYATGDSVPLTIAVSDAGFYDLTACHCKDAIEFHGLVPRMPDAVYSSEDVKFSVIAVQVTLFPDQGVCIGFTHHHSICDAVTLSGFVHTWASLNESGGDEGGLLQDFLPSYGRDRVQDAERLGILGWEQMKTRIPTFRSTPPSPLDKLRATFILSDAEIGRLKKNPLVSGASTFVVVCAHLWSCLAKSAGDGVDVDEPEYLVYPVDCRRRLTPPLPDNYFGNCITLLLSVSTHGRLKGDDGFVAAVEAITASLNKTIVNHRVALDYFESRSLIQSELKGKRVVWIVGSVRLDHYSADYGWGKATKYECINTDYFGGVHLCKARDGGVEIGLSLPEAKMDSFAAVMKKFLHINSNL